jgi:hypothetical protein
LSGVKNINSFPSFHKRGSTPNLENHHHCNQTTIDHQ